MNKINKRAILKLLALSIVFGVIYKFGIPAYKIYSAKHELELVGIPFSEQKFIEAACNGDKGTVQLFIQAGMNLNVLAAPGKNDGISKSALQCAVSKGDVTMSKSLIEQGGNVNLQDEEGNTALWYAARTGGMSRDGTAHGLEIAKLLIEHGADINLQGDKGSPFMSSMASNQTELADYLVERGANVKATSKDGSTALMELLQRGYGANRTEIITRAKSLIKAGVNVNAQNKSGQTALLIACNSRNYPLLEALLDAGADPNLASPNGQTPIYLTVYDPEAFRVLTKHGANLNVKVDGSTLLQHAVSNGNNMVVSALLATGKLDVNAKNDSGESALFYIASRGNGAIAQQLLAAGASPDITNNQLQTPIIRAVQNNALDMVRILIDWNANVNLRDGTGKTALYYAKQRLESLGNQGYIVNGAPSAAAAYPRMLPMPTLPAMSNTAAGNEVLRKMRANMQEVSRSYAAATAPSATATRITVSDPMVDMLVKAGAHL